MSAPMKGTPERARYRKKQWEYRKKHYYKIMMELRYGKDDDLIHNLTQFDGNRNAFMKETLRKALKESGKDTYVPGEPPSKTAPDTSDLEKEIETEYGQYLHRKRK